MEFFKNRMACVMVLLLPLAFVLAATAAPVAPPRTRMTFHAFPAATSQSPCDHPIRLPLATSYHTNTAYNAEQIYFVAAENTGIVAKDGTRVSGFTSHGVDRAIGDAAKRAGVKPEAILDALKNPERIVKGVDLQGRPFERFYGKNAHVVVNPQTGRVVSVNPLSGAGAH